MNITTKLAQFAAKYFNLANDDKVYGIKNGNFFEVPSGGGDDGITKENFITNLLNGTTLVDAFAPEYYKRAIGYGKLVHYGMPQNGTPIMFGGNTGGYSANVIGTGAAISNGLNLLQCISGTLATGVAGFSYLAAVDSAASTTNPYNPVLASTSSPVDFCAACSFHVSALSDATNAYTVRLGLFNNSSVALSATPAAADAGISITYNHAVNSGNLVIHYRNAAGTLSSINTSIPPSTVLATPTTIRAIARRLTASTSQITVTINSTEFVITDSALNANTVYTNAAIGLAIFKSAGTTARTAFMRNALIGRTL